MSRKFETIIKVRVSDNLDVISKVFSILEHEMKFSRGFVRIETHNEHLIIRIFAKDLTSLRSLTTNALKMLYIIVKFSQKPMR